MSEKAPKKLPCQGKWWLSSGKIVENHQRKRRVLLQLEELETRSLLSANAVSATVNEQAQTNVSVSPQASTSFSGYTPQQLQTAYGLSSLIGSSTSGYNAKSDGTGETIAIVDAYDDPNIQKDLAAFDSKYNLPAASLTVVNQAGAAITSSTTTQQGRPAADPTGGWEVEESLDVEWAHAIAPGAKIVLVEANSSRLNDLLSSVDTAVSQGANVVSMSWGGSEFAGETSYDSHFTAKGVTFVASAGDNSAYAGPEWPASSPNVLAVGGSTLKLTSTNTISSESAWSASYSWYYGLEGGGGGVSSYESEPSFQTSNIGNYGGRSTPDVSWDANPSTGVSIYDSYRESGWGYVGGSSAGAPAWAGIVALADQQNGSSLSTSQVETTLYGVYHSNPSSATYQSAFHDIKSGSNGYSAGAGYDPATGLGSPNVGNIVHLLAPSSGSASILGASTSNSGSSGISSAVSGGATGGSSGRHHADLFVVVLFDAADFSGASLAVSAVGGASGSSLSAFPSSGAAANSNGLFLLGLPGQGAQSLTLTNSPNATGTADASAGRASILFGASGWMKSASSWSLSSLGLPGSLVEPLGDDSADRPDGEDSDSSTGDAVGMIDDSAEEDTPLLDDAAASLDGAASDGGE